MTKHDNVSQGKNMKATEFVKKFGLEKSKEAIDKVAWCETAYCLMLGHGCFKSNSDCCVDIKELKRLVESFETVGIWGGLPAAKAHLTSLAERCANGGLESVRGQYKILRKAIADVEACQ